MFHECIACGKVSYQIGWFSKKHRPLIEICPDVDNPNQNKQDSPAGECTHPPADALHIKDVSDDQGPHNLGDPVKETIKRTGPNVEDSTVVVIEF